MLKKIVSIAGRPGLYRLVNQGKNMLIVENVTDGKRMPVYARDKVISLGDVSIYTVTGDGDTPLAGVLESIKALGQDINPKKADSADIRKAFSQAVPDMDDERINTSDIRKVYQWYNILAAAGITDFAEKEQATTDSTEAPADTAEATEATEEN